jgi:rod shape-determining protein MreB
MFIRKLGIDLGTANTLVFIPQKGVAINEPSVVAVSKYDNVVLAVGNEAREMIGRTPDTIIAYRPLRDGVIADYRVTEAMLRYFINKAGGKIRLFRPEIMVSVPAGVTSTERRAVIEATVQAGAKAAYVVKEPVLAAIGAGIPINEPVGHMVVDIGGGTTEVIVVSLGGIVASRSLRIAGDKLNEDIIEYLKDENRLLIGERTAEEIKISIGSVWPLEEELSMEISGRDLVTGLPKEIRITSPEIRKALMRSTRIIINAIKDTIEETPPELISDLTKRAIHIAGGGSLLRGFDVLLSHETKLPVKIVDDPLTAVVRGCGIVLEDVDKLKDILVNTENKDFR